MPEELPSRAIVTDALVALTIDSWRFAKSFARLVSKVDVSESVRYESQYRYYMKRLAESLSAAGLRVVNVEGHAYDPGSAVTPLNLSDFDADDLLVVEQMIEPIIMGPDALVRQGTVMLRKAYQIQATSGSCA